MTFSSSNLFCQSRLTGDLLANRGGISIIALFISTATGFRSLAWDSNPSLLLFLFLPEGELPVDRVITVASDNKSRSYPHVHYRWRDEAGDIQTTVLTEGYNLQLHFDKAIDGQVAGKLRFDVPGEDTRLQGEFSLRVDEARL